MAGVQWSGGKLTRSQFGAAQRHNEKEERLKRKHSNEDIDKSETGRDWSVNGLSYKERMQKLDNRLSEIDMGRKSRGKNQRVVAQSLLGYVPPEIEAQGGDAVREWVMGFYACVAEQVGEENIIDADVHCDERHEYVDPDTGEVVMSRIHVHLVFVPVVTEEVRQIKEQKLDENGEPERDARGKIRYRVTGREKVQLDKPKLNAKQVAARANITRLNKSVDDMTFEKFGVRYVTGKGKKGARSKKVEQLKIESAKAAEKKLAELERDLERARVETETELRKRRAVEGESYQGRDGRMYLGTKGLLAKNEVLRENIAELDVQVRAKREEVAKLDMRVSEQRSELQELTPKIESARKIEDELKEREHAIDVMSDQQEKERIRLQVERESIAAARRVLQDREDEVDREMRAYKDALDDLERVSTAVSVDDVVQAVFDEIDERTRMQDVPSYLTVTPRKERPYGMWGKLTGIWQDFTSWLKETQTRSGTSMFQAVVDGVKERVSPRERARRMPSVRVADTYMQERTKSNDRGYGDI